MRTKESLEELLARVLRNAESVVAHFDDQLTPGRGIASFEAGIDVHAALGFARIAVLDRIRHVVGEAELHRRRIHLHLRHAIGDLDLHTAPARELPQLPHGFGDRRPHDDVALLARITLEPREADEILERRADRLGVLADHSHEALALRLLEKALVEQRRRAEDCPDAILELVRHHAVEAAQPFLALAHLPGQELEEMRRRRLLNDRDRAKHAMGAEQQLPARARLLDLIHRLGEEGEEHAAKELVLLQDLVDVEALTVPKGAELARLRDDRHVGADLAGRIFEIVGDAAEQQRHMVEQLFGGKDPVRVEGDARGNPLEPATG